MGMLLRRREKKALVEPKVNGKPVVKEPKNKKLNKEPDYVKKVENTVPTYKA
jgi:hypothetical protein